jgi:hypothetical protein
MLGALLIVGYVSSCKKEEAPPAEKANAAQPATPGKTGTASITGTITYAGAPLPPPPKPLRTPDCARFAQEGDLSLVVAKEGGGLKNAFVWIKDGLPAGEYPVPTEHAVLDQKGCEYTPRVFGMRAGQPLDLVNSDPMLHNVHGSSDFNIPLPNPGMRATRTFPRPEVVKTITCDVHPWMRSYAGVTTHPFFAVTNEAGKFEIKSLPAGTFTIEVWHERLGRKAQQVTVGEGETKALSVALSQAAGQ